MIHRPAWLVTRSAAIALALLLASAIGWDGLTLSHAQVAVAPGRLLGASRLQLAWLDWDAPRPVFLTSLAAPAVARDVAAIPGSHFQRRVERNLVSREDTVRQVVAKIQLGEGDAAVVYTTDVTPHIADQFVRIPVPDDLQVIATYPIAVTHGRNASGGEAFMHYVLSAAAQAVLARWGFLPGEG